MASVATLGSASGLPLDELLKNLETAENKKIELMTIRQTSFETRFSAYSKVSSAVEAVQKAAAVLGKASTLTAIKGSVVGEGLTATVGADNVVAGQYSIEITSLASVQTLKANSVPDRKASNGAAGEFEIELANGTKSTVKLTDDTSLDGIMKAINADDKLGARATVISDGNGGNFLMISSKETGTAASVKSITVTSGDPALSDILTYNSTGTSKMTATAATDANITINGISITSGSNNIATAIDGVTLNLTAVSTKPITLKLENDPSVASKAVQDFVKVYNALQTTISELTAFDAKASTQSALTGDGTTRSIQSSLANALRVVGGTSGMSSLADMGITTNPKDRTLTLDQTKLDKALASNPADVSRLLTGKDGLAAKFDEATKEILGTTGSIKARQDGLTKSIDTVKEQVVRTKASIAVTMDGYRTQFIALDKFMAMQKTTSDYLTAQFAAMNKSSS